MTTSQLPSVTTHPVTESWRTLAQALRPGDVLRVKRYDSSRFELAMIHTVDVDHRRNGHVSVFFDGWRMDEDGYRRYGRHNEVRVFERAAGVVYFESANPRPGNGGFTRYTITPE